MTDAELIDFLCLLMCSDPFPLDQESHDRLVAMADRESRVRGFETWIDAYHVLSRISRREGLSDPEAARKARKSWVRTVPN